MSEPCRLCGRSLYAGPIEAYTKDYCWHSGANPCLYLVLRKAMKQMEDGLPHDAYLTLEVAASAEGT